MKRPWNVLPAAALVLTMAAPLFAAEITVGGDVFLRGRYWENRDLDRKTFVPAAQSPTGREINFRDPGPLENARFNQRTRIRVEAKIEEGLSALVELETWGRLGSGAAGPDATTLVGLGSEGAGVPAARFAWLDARVPGTPVTFRLGRQPLLFGHAFVFDTSVFGGDAITARGPLFGWTWQIGWLKTRESDVIGAERGLPSGIVQPDSARAGVDDDADWYLFGIKGSPAANQFLDLYAIWHLDNGVLVSPTAFQQASGPGRTCSPGSPAECIPTLGVPVGAVSGGGANEVTLGVAWDARFGPLVPRFEFDYQGGTAYRTTRLRKAVVSRNAFLIAGGADYNLTPQWRISMDGGLGSGNGKNPADPDFDSTKALFLPHHTSGVPAVFIDELGNRGFFTLGNGVTNRQFEYVGLTNVGFFQIAPAWTPVPQWSFRVDVTKLFLHRTFDGMGTARCVDPATGTNPPIEGCGRPSKDLGWSFGAAVTYRPYRNLTTVWWVGAFVPGNYFDRGLPTSGPTARKADTALVLRWHAFASF